MTNKQKEWLLTLEKNGCIVLTDDDLLDRVKIEKNVLKNGVYDISGQIVVNESDRKVLGVNKQLESSLVLDKNNYLLFKTIDLNGRNVTFNPKYYHGITNDNIFVRELMCYPKFRQVP